MGIQLCPKHCQLMYACVGTRTDSTMQKFYMHHTACDKIPPRGLVYVVSDPFGVKKEVYRGGIKREGDKIGMGMGCSTRFTYNIHIVSVLTFSESTAQSL